MTWGDIKLATMQKMFSADGTEIPSDDSSKDYLAGMPYVANECLQMICTSKKYIVKSVDVNSADGDQVGQFRRFRMKDLAEDFFEFYGEVYITAGNYHERCAEYRSEAQDVLLIRSDLEGVYTIFYRAYPPSINAATEDDYAFDGISPDVLAILPLYMASQLYKEDDNGIATSLRNEFEVAYERLSQDNPSYILECEDEGGW